MEIPYSISFIILKELGDINQTENCKLYLINLEGKLFIWATVRDIFRTIPVELESYYKENLFGGTYFFVNFKDKVKLKEMREFWNIRSKSTLKFDF